MTTATVELLRRLIRNGCVNDGSASSGNESRSVGTLIDYFGLPGTIVEPAPGRQSLVYRVEGADPAAPSLALLTHIDVVPANVDGWSVDPFAAEIHEGFVWGRGAVDMLNVVASMAAAFRPYLFGEKELAGDLVFIAAADEESGGRYGAQALVEENWDLVRAGNVLCEVAHPAINADPDHPVIPIVVGEKGPHWTRMSARGIPGHGSAPYGSDNAIVTLAEATSGIAASPMPVEITDTWRRFVTALDLDADMKTALTDPDTVDTAIDTLAADDPALARYAHAATHMTVSPNTVMGGTKTNVIADGATATVDIRTLPGTGREEVDRYLRKSMGSAGDRIDLEPILDQDSGESEPGGLLWESVCDSIEEHTGSRSVVPTLMTGFTDARLWRQRGSVAYGVGLFDDSLTFSEFLTLFHGNDERVSLRSVDLTTAMLATALDRFAARSASAGDRS